MSVGDYDIAAASALIKKWVNDRRIKLADAPARVADDTSFQFCGTFENGLPFTIIQPRVLPNAIVILAEVAFGKEHVESVKAMNPSDRNKFLGDLKRDIQFAGPSYAFNPDFDKTGVLTAIQFSQEIYFDGLTEDRLNEAVRSVTKTAFWTVWVIRKKLDPIVV